MSRGPFFDRIAQAQAKLDRSGQGVWYRGIKKKTYELLPSYLRHKGLVGREHNLIARFSRQGARYFTRDNKWERLAFMQHYGVPTKLMDWTTNVTAALYFALAFRVESADELDNPMVRLLNPFRLNDLSPGVGRKIFDNMDDPPEFKPERMKENPWLYDLPIAIAVDWHDDRIEHQQGVFTYHGNKKQPLDCVAKGCLEKVEIKKSEIGDLLDHLRDAGVTHHRMLRDPDSLGRDITEHALRTGILWRDPKASLPTGNVEDDAPIGNLEPVTSARSPSGPSPKH